MAATARQQGVPWVCVTSGSAAVETPERQEMALACGISVPALTNSSDAQCAAGASGSMEVIRHLHRLGVPTSDAVLFSAARARRTGILYRFPVLARERNVQVKMSTWMAVYERFLSDSYNDEQQRAALIWLSQQVRPLPVWYCSSLCVTAAENGQLAALKFLMHDDHGQALFGPLIPDSLVIDFESPEWINAPACDYIQTNGTFSGRATLMEKAAASGHVEVLQWLHQEHALPFRSVTMSYAAKHGHLTALQWLYEAGCPHDINELCDVSLDNPMMKRAPPQMEWLRGIGGSWSREQVTEALSSLVGYRGAEKLISWLRSEGAEWPSLAQTLQGGYAADDCDEGEVGAVLWAAQQGCPWGDWTPRCCAQVSRGRYSIKEAPHAAGCPCQCD
ncbi:hypothetical protein JKP88DRAFT_263679 [Tribonema minus]|uniref:Uncharacterized protein n=1 Tax=Tribonema minus TaxID=303371 RepID=A0A836CDJ7_9STRA|nr:hypothetical protein JKP88DRAFT_263679 [Tribonema minus]